MTRSIVPLSLLLLSGCITELPEVANPCGEWKQTGLFKHTTEVQGEKRKAYVFIPEGSEGPRDMVVVLHGGATSARTMSDATEHIELARKEGFVAVFPQGTKPFLRKYAWNAGDCCLSADENERDIDDIAYLEKMAKELKQQTCSTRILATGFSNGGMLTHRWACTSDQVDAAVPVSGPLVAHDGCTGKPIPMRHYHGDNDPIVPIEGSKKHDIPPLLDALEPWIERNQCTSSKAVRTEQKGDMTCSILDCAAPTELCILHGWKHMWPGGVLKDQTKPVDATVDGWEFFRETLGPNPG